VDCRAGGAGQDGGDVPSISISKVVLVAVTVAILRAWIRPTWIRWVPAAARHASADNRFTELLALSQVKRAVAWATVQRAWAGQPRTGASRLTDQRALGQVKRQASWKAVHRAAGR
jgi:hypothetical protein